MLKTRSPRNCAPHAHALRFARFGGVFALAALLPRAAFALSACDDLKLDDAQPPYVGSGYQGGPLSPDASEGVLGMAAVGVNLQSWIPLGGFPGINTRGSDIWGYVAPSGREYAILGMDAGTGFVEITNPALPVVVGYIPSVGTLWKEITTYDQYAYIVSDQVGNGMQVVDLTQIDVGTVTLVRTVTDNGLATVHTIRVNPASHYIYLCGSNLGGGGLLPYNVQNPANPVPGPMIWQGSYVHDVVVRSFTSGPYAGREFAYCCTGYNGFAIVDVTNKSNLFTTSSVSYPNMTYCHYAWLTPDGARIYIGDELDELYSGVPTSTTYILNVASVTAPTYVGSFTNGNPAIDHNPIGSGNFLFEANYRSGLRIYDISNPLNIHEVGWYDTYPDDDEKNFNGLWGVHVMPSGTVIGSDMERGLFVFDTSATTGVGDSGPLSDTRLLPIRPNPFRDRVDLSFFLAEPSRVSLRLYDPSGRLVHVLADGELAGGRHLRSVAATDFGSEFHSGVYFLRLEAPGRTQTERLIHLR